MNSPLTHTTIEQSEQRARETAEVYRDDAHIEEFKHRPDILQYGKMEHFLGMAEGLRMAQRILAGTNATPDS